MLEDKIGHFVNQEIVQMVAQNTLLQDNLVAKLHFCQIMDKEEEVLRIQDKVVLRIQDKVVLRIQIKVVLRNQDLN